MIILRFWIKIVTNLLNNKKVRKMGKSKFVGSTIIYSYLQAIGAISSHEEECFMYKGK